MRISQAFTQVIELYKIQISKVLMMQNMIENNTRNLGEINENTNIPIYRSRQVNSSRNLPSLNSVPNLSRIKNEALRDSYRRIRSIRTNTRNSNFPLEPALKMITITLEETLIDHTKDQTITWVTLDQTIRLIQAQEVLQEVLDLALDLQMVFLDHQHLVQQEQEKLIKCQN